jgi:hypothetical protein
LRGHNLTGCKPDLLKPELCRKPRISLWMMIRAKSEVK